MWHRRPGQGVDNGTSSPTVGRGIRKNKLGDRPPRLRCVHSCFTISSVMKIQINFSGEHQLICVKQQTVGQMWHIKPNGNNLSLRQGSQHGNATSLAPRHVDERQSRRPGSLGVASTGVCLFGLTDQSSLAVSFKSSMRWKRAGVQAEAHIALSEGLPLVT